MSPRKDPAKGWRPKPYHHRKPGQKIGLLRVRIAGQAHYCGRWDDPAAWAEYDRLIAEWSAANYATPQAAPGATLNQLLLAHLEYASHYYRGDRGYLMPHYYQLRQNSRIIRPLYGDLPCRDFGPQQLKAVREKFVAAGWSRRHVNAQVNKLRGVFRWGVEHGYCPVEVWQALTAVAPLRAGKTAAPDPEPAVELTSARVEAVLPHLPAVLQDLVRIEWLTGMRPGEVCRLRGADIDRAGEVWLYAPKKHKGAHMGKKRRIWLGPRAQAILAPRVLKYQDGPLFPALKYTRVGGRAFSAQVYRRRLREACATAGVEPWTPKQLRALRATEVETAYNLEHAKSVLGHSKSNVTALHYARADDAMAQKVAREIG